jgi:glycerol-3-phosphate dehydrogenase
MAEDVMETAIQRQLLRAAPCRTADLPLHGATNMPNDLPPSGTGSPDRYYGADLPLVQAMPGADNVLVPASGLTEAHVRFAARYELARRVEDVLARRNRALFLDARAAQDGAPGGGDPGGGTRARLGLAGTRTRGLRQARQGLYARMIDDTCVHGAGLGR